MLGTEFVSPLPRFKEEEQKNKGKNDKKVEDLGFLPAVRSIDSFMGMV